MIAEISSDNLLRLFFLLTFANSFFIISTVVRAKSIFDKWSPKIDELNDVPESVSNEEVDEFEGQTEDDKFIYEIIEKVKKIAVNSRDMPVHEIHEIIDDDIMKWESRINASANLFLMFGVLFTVLGLFSGLPGGEIDPNVIKNLLANFKIAFQTTIWGISASFVAKLLQTYISQRRDRFRYSLVLLIKNLIVPKYAIQEADEKNLGEMLRTISKSSIELEKAAVAVQQMAEGTKVGTENIEKSINQFADVTEKMSDREDSLISSLSKLRENLNNIKVGLNETFPELVDSMRNDIRDYQTNNTTSIEGIKDLRDEQVKINKRMGKSLTKISDSQKKMGEFFGNDFTNIFKFSLKEISDQYIGHIDEIRAGVASLQTKLDSTVISDDISSQFSDFKKLFNDKISDIYDEVTPIRPGIDSLRTSLSNIESLDEDNQTQITELHKTATEMSNKMVSLHDNIYSMSTAMERVGENTLFVEKEQIEPIKDYLNVLSIDLGSIKDEMNKLIKSVDNISKLGGTGTSILDGIKNIFPGAKVDSK